MGTWLAEHWIDVLLAVVFAVGVDLMSLGSHLRGLIRLVKNKNAERSVKSLRKQIKRYEEYRDTFRSEKAIYLACFRYVFGLLMLLSGGGLVLVLVHSQMAAGAPYSVAHLLDMLVFLCFGLAVVCGGIGIKYAASDTHEKVAVQVSKIDMDIAKLKAALARRENARTSK